MSKINTEQLELSLNKTTRPSTGCPTSMLTSTEIDDKQQTNVHKGIINSIQTLRKYKMGMSPKHKNEVLAHTMATKQPEIPSTNVLNTASKTVHVPSSVRDRFSSVESLESRMTDTFLDNSTAPHEEKPQPTPAPRPESKKKIVVKCSPSNNLDLYQLTSQPVTATMPHMTTENIGTTASSPFEFSAAQMSAPSPPRPSTAPSVTVGNAKVPMYTPSTYRVPSKEVVYSFGGQATTVSLTSDAIEMKNAYEQMRANSAKASSPKSSKAKMHQGVAIPQPSSERGGLKSENSSEDGDSYLDDRKEVFLQDSIRSVDDDHTHKSGSSRPGTTGSQMTSGSRGVLHGSREKSPGRSRSIDAFKNTISIDNMHNSLDKPRGSPLTTDHESAGDSKRKIKRLLTFNYTNIICKFRLYQTDWAPRHFTEQTRTRCAAPSASRSLCCGASSAPTPTAGSAGARSRTTAPPRWPRRRAAPMCTTFASHACQCKATASRRRQGLPRATASRWCSAPTEAMATGRPISAPSCSRRSRCLAQTLW